MLRPDASLVAGTVLAVVLAVGLTACLEPGADSGPGARPASAAPPTRATSAHPEVSAAPERSAGPETSDGRPAKARLSIPKLGIGGLVVVPYRGKTDDAAGTEIQNRGLAASPNGPDGGAGPGGVGHYQ